jgi:hypothetical protein
MATEPGRGGGPSASPAGVSGPSRVVNPRSAKGEGLVYEHDKLPAEPNGKPGDYECRAHYKKPFHTPEYRLRSVSLFRNMSAWRTGASC